MWCANKYCIYYRKNQCSRAEISLDMEGKCKDCVLVKIDEKTLDRLRRSQVMLKETIRPKNLWRQRGEMRKIEQIRELSHKMEEEYRKMPMIHVSTDWQKIQKREQERLEQEKKEEKE